MTNYRGILRLSSLGLNNTRIAPLVCRISGDIPCQLTRFKKYYRDFTAELNEAIAERLYEFINHTDARLTGCVPK